MMNERMSHFDVFNGDADGILSLVQLRLAEPKNSQLITGVKRDIQLVQQVDLASACSMTILDISMEKNMEALEQALASGVDVFYVDHHRTGDIPAHPKLHTVIDTGANTCTALLVNNYLNGRFARWAVAAAFGDNMTASAMALAQEIGLSEAEQSSLKALGIYINYNGYGQKIDDLHFHPAALYQLLVAYENPLDLISEQDSVFHQLEQAYQQDMQQANQADILINNDLINVVLLPDEAWARRVSGVLGNELANQSPDKAHAVLTYNDDKISYTVSVRAPLNNKQGADSVCIQFATGGGRSGAAGINKLPIEDADKFIDALFAYYQNNHNRVT